MSDVDDDGANAESGATRVTVRLPRPPDRQMAEWRNEGNTLTESPYRNCHIKIILGISLPQKRREEFHWKMLSIHFLITPFTFARASSRKCDHWVKLKWILYSIYSPSYFYPHSNEIMQTSTFAEHNKRAHKWQFMQTESARLNQFLRQSHHKSRQSAIPFRLLSIYSRREEKKNDERKRKGAKEK